MTQRDELKQEEQLAGQGVQRQAFRRLGTLLHGHWTALITIMLIQAIAVFTSSPTWIIEYVIDDGFSLTNDGTWRVVSEVALWASLGLAVMGSTVYLPFGGAFGSDYTGGQLLSLRIGIYAHLQHLSISYFDRTRTGRIVARVDRDVDALQPLFLDGIPQLLGIALRCGGGAIMLTIIYPMPSSVC